MIRRTAVCLFLLVFVFSLLPHARAEDLDKEEILMDIYREEFGPDVELEIGEDGVPVTVNGYPFRFVEARFNILGLDDWFTAQTDWLDYPFWQPATEYDGCLAQMSLIMAMCAARDRPKSETPETFDPARNVEEYLLNAGFTDIRKDDYSKETSIYTISTAIGARRMEHEGEESFTLLAVGVCGAGYKNEWQSNITAGSGELHEGFRSASDLVIDRIAGYIATRGIKGRVKLWISGFSRAAAVANLTAGRLTQAGAFSKEDVFAYTFATPAAVLNPAETGHEKIFNILCPTDVVPQVMPAEWGYGRYGKDLWIPVQEFSTLGEAVSMERELLVKRTFGIDVHYSASLNLRMRLLYSMMLEAIGDNSAYVRNVQDKAVKVMQQINPSSLLSTMRSLLLGAKDGGREMRVKLDHLLDYLFRVFGNALTRTELAAVNRNSGKELFLLFTEHREDSYLGGLNVIRFGLFEEDMDFNYIMVKGPVDLTLTIDGLPGWSFTLTEKGSVLEKDAESPEPEVNPEFQEFYLERIGDVSIAAIPNDLDIRAQWTAVSEGTVEILQASCNVHAASLYPGSLQDPVTVRTGDSGTAWLPESQTGTLPEGFRAETWRASNLTGFLGISSPVVSWRILAAVVLLLIGLGVFLLIRLVSFFLPNMNRNGAAFWILLAIFCVSAVEAEGSFWLLADMPWIRFTWKAVTGAAILSVFFLRRRPGGSLWGSVLPGLVAAVAADLISVWAFLPGAAVYLMAHILLIVCFLKKQALRPVQWIQWAVLSALTSGLILLAFSARMGTGAWVAAVYAPVLLLMVYSSSGQDPRIRYAASFFLVSDFLLGVYAAVWADPLSHIPRTALFVASLMLLATHEGSSD